jgi:hypothetical protein
MNTTSVPGIAFRLTSDLERVKKRSTKVRTKRDLSGAYFHLFAGALLVNLYVLSLDVVGDSFKDPNFLACMATGNIFVAILVRNELFLNVLYRILVKIFSLSQVPIGIKNGVTSALLHIGGIHARCAVASVVWLTVDVFHPLSTGSVDRHWVIVPLCSVMLLFVTIMCIMSLPAIRDRSHDLFEFTHRFLGWSTLLLLWGYALLTVNWSSETAESGLFVATTKNHPLAYGVYYWSDPFTLVDCPEGPSSRPRSIAVDHRDHVPWGFPTWHVRAHQPPCSGRLARFCSYLRRNYG